MSFTKIKKEDWDNLSQEQREYYTLEFNKSNESFRRKTIFATRTIAIFLILGLFYMGWVQLEVTKGATNAINKYGPLGYCYLCGYENLRSCECTYNQIDWGVETNDIYSNMTLLKDFLANKNIQSCNMTKQTYGLSSKYEMNYTDFAKLIVK